MNRKMNAALITHYKQEYPTIETVDMLKIGANDVLVKIVAASINPIDLKTKDGGLKMLLKYHMPLILGSDFAGVVTEVGAKVTTFQKGDAVYGRVQKNRIGTFAEYIAVDQGDIARKPQNLSFEEAAAVPLVGLTSYQALHDIMQIQPGQRVLIQAGSGGIGTIAIQLAKQMGAYVATTTSEKNRALVESLGADEVIDYRTQQFYDVLENYDYVFDTQGGKILEQAFRIIKPGGKVVSISGLPNARFADEYNVPFWKKFAFRLVTRNITKLEKTTQADYYFLFMKPSGQQLAILSRMIEEEKIHPVIDRVLPFTQIAQAFEYSHSGRAKGKIILKMFDPSVEHE
uniref:NADP-dependent oxidoreductase n=1 Tax=Candidatus Enterococcus willemsii TaxID=1857215 RepID=UPI00403FA07E